MVNDVEANLVEVGCPSTGFGTLLLHKHGIDPGPPWNGMFIRRFMEFVSENTL